MGTARSGSAPPTEAPEMSPNQHSTRPLRPIFAILAAIAVAACSGKAPPPAAPSAAIKPPAAVSSATAPSSDDSGLVIGRSGDDGLQLILADSGERIFAMPAGVPGRDWSQLVSASVTGTSTTIRDLRLPEMDSSSHTIDGAWRLPTIGLDPTPVGVSDDGHTIVLVETSRATGRSRFAIVDRTAAAPPRFVELTGEFEYDALSPDGSILYVVEHLPGPPDGHYQVRAVDTASGIL